jgi:hypothetical protein
VPAGARERHEVVPDLAAAVERILERSRQRPRS